MSTKKSVNYQKIRPVDKKKPFEYIVIIEEKEQDLFIQQTLVKSLELGQRVEKRTNPDEVLLEIKLAQRLKDIPDLIMLSVPVDAEQSNNFLDKFALLPDLIRARCKLIIITYGATKEEKLRAIMNPSVIRYLEKPIDACQFHDLMIT